MGHRTDPMMDWPFWTETWRRVVIKRLRTTACRLFIFDAERAEVKRGKCGLNICLA